MKRFTWRALLYAIVLGYLVLDLKVCHGPLREAMRSRRDAAVAAAGERGWVALVNLEPLTREQLDLAVARHLHQRGREAGEIPEKSLALIRRAVLQSLIDDTLVRQYADGDGFEAPPEETAAFAESWKGAFASAGEMEKRAAALGLDPASFESELARIWSRKRWLERRLEPGVDVTEEEARDWFEENRLAADGSLRPGFHEPEALRLRQLRFGPDGEAEARAWRARVAGGAPPGTPPAENPAAPDVLEEEAWVAAEALPEPIAEVVEAVAAGEWSEPVPTALGWHIVQVLERREARPLGYEELRDEIFTLLEAERREETFRELMEKLRKVANWQIFPENL